MLHPKNGEEKVNIRNEDNEKIEGEKTTISIDTTERVTFEALEDINHVRSYRMSSKNKKETCVEIVMKVMSIIITIWFFPFSLFCIFMMVRQFERAVILRFGKLYKDKVYGPGLVCYLPCIDTYKLIDLRIICYAVPPQDALTKDSLTVTVDAVVFYKIFEPIWAVLNVVDYKQSTEFLAATTLRNALGTRKLAELLVNRAKVSSQVFQLMKAATKDWGIHVVKVDIKNISLPLQLQKAMAAEAESTRLANAKIIVAKSEIESTKSLMTATQMLMENPMCMQLRYLQSLNSIASTNSRTIVFPFSAETFRKIFK